MNGKSSLLLALLLAALAPRAAGAPPPEAAPADLVSRTKARLEALLDDPDRGVRYAAVVAFGKAGGDAPILARRLGDDAWCVRREAGWWLRRAHPDGFDALHAGVASEDPRVRATAAWALSGFGGRAVPDLARALEDPVEPVRREALASLRRIGSPAAAAVPGVRARVGQPDASPAERYEAALTLVVLAPDACADAVPVLEQNAGGSNSWECVAALLRAGPPGEKVLQDRARALASPLAVLRDGRGYFALGPDDGRAGTPPGRAAEDREDLPPLRDPASHVARAGTPLARLASPDASTRARAALELGDAGASASTFAPLLDDPERDVRIAAAFALGRATDDVVTPLLGALGDENPRVRWTAIESLAGHGAAAPRVAPFLADENLVISHAAYESLARDGASAAVPVAAALATGSYAAVEWAPRVFAVLGPEGAAATEGLAHLLSVPDENVREAAARCLLRIGAPARAAVPALVRALADESLPVASWASIALGQTGLAEATFEALADPRAQVRAYAAWAAGWALGAARGVDQVPFEVVLPVLSTPRSSSAPSRAEVEAALAELAARGSEDAPRDASAALAGQEVLLRAIWSADAAVAARAANALPYTELDEAEAERVVQVLLPEGQRQDAGVDFGSLRKTLGSAELPSLLSYVTRATRTTPPRIDIYSNCHRISRADTLPALYYFGRVEEPEALQGWSDLWMPDAHSDRHARVRAADAVGFDPGPDEADILRALLRFDLAGDGPVLLGSLEIWLLDRFRPEPEDASLLLEVARRVDESGDWHGGHGAYLATLRAMGYLDDAETRSYLEEVAGRDPGTDAGGGEESTRAAWRSEACDLARASLARRGDPEALETLVAGSGKGVRDLVLLLEVAPDRAYEEIRRRLEDPEAATACLDDLGSIEDEAVMLGAHVSESAWLGLEPALARTPPPARVLARVVVTVPLARTRRLGGILFSELETAGPSAFYGPLPAPSPTAPDEGVEDGLLDALEADHAVAFLASVEADRLRALLRTWAAHAPDAVRDWARNTLLRLGDPARAADVLAWCETGLVDGRTDASWQVGWLARSDAPVVRAWLRARATSSAEAKRSATRRSRPSPPPRDGSVRCPGTATCRPGGRTPCSPTAWTTPARRPSPGPVGLRDSAATSEAPPGSCAWETVRERATRGLGPRSGRRCGAGATAGSTTSSTRTSTPSGTTRPRSRTGCSTSTATAAASATVSRMPASSAPTSTRCRGTGPSPTTPTTTASDVLPRGTSSACSASPGAPGCGARSWTRRTGRRGAPSAGRSCLVPSDAQPGASASRRRYHARPWSMRWERGRGGTPRARGSGAGAPRWPGTRSASRRSSGGSSSAGSVSWWPSSARRAGLSSS